MYGIILNIIAYLLMAVGAYRAFSWSHKHGTRFTMVINYFLMFWNIFMVIYLSTNISEILKQPLNELLNFYESMTNILVAAYLLSFNLKKIK
jgi:hypothetical protein